MLRRMCSVLHAPACTGLNKHVYLGHPFPTPLCLLYGTAVRAIASVADRAGSEGLRLFGMWSSEAPAVEETPETPEESPEQPSDGPLKDPLLFKNEGQLEMQIDGGEWITCWAQTEDIEGTWAFTMYTVPPPWRPKPDPDEEPENPAEGEGELKEDGGNAKAEKGEPELPERVVIDSVDLLKMSSIEVVNEKPEKLDAAAEMIGQIEMAIAGLDGNLESFDNLSTNEK